MYTSLELLVLYHKVSTIKIGNIYLTTFGITNEINIGNNSNVKLVNICLTLHLTIGYIVLSVYKKAMREHT